MTLRDESDFDGPEPKKCQERVEIKGLSKIFKRRCKSLPKCPKCPKTCYVVESSQHRAWAGIFVLEPED